MEEKEPRNILRPKNQLGDISNASPLDEGLQAIIDCWEGEISNSYFWLKGDNFLIIFVCVWVCMIYIIPKFISWVVTIFMFCNVLDINKHASDDHTQVLSGVSPKEVI